MNEAEANIKRLENEARKAILEGFDWITEGINSRALLQVCVERSELMGENARLQKELINMEREVLDAWDWNRRCREKGEQ